MTDPKRTVEGSPQLRFLLGVSCALAALTACDATISGGSGAGGAGTVVGGPSNLNGGGTSSVSSSGSGSDPGGGSSLAGGGTIGPVTDPNAVGPRPLYRLTRREYNNTVHDLLGDTTHPADTFPDDRDRSFLFRRAGVVATQDAHLLRSTAAALAATAMKTPTSVLPCDPTGGEDACSTKV